MQSTVGAWGPPVFATRVAGTAGTVWADFDTVHVADASGTREIPAPDDLPVAIPEPPPGDLLNSAYDNLHAFGIDLAPYTRLSATFLDLIEGRSGTRRPAARDLRRRRGRHAGARRDPRVGTDRRVGRDRGLACAAAQAQADGPVRQSASSGRWRAGGRSRMVSQAQADGPVRQSASSGRWRAGGRSRMVTASPPRHPRPAARPLPGARRPRRDRAPGSAATAARRAPPRARRTRAPAGRR